MATKVKGITIELSADASGLETALKNANKELSATQKQLSSVNKALKLDPGNVELIEQKQRLLAKAVDESTKKLQALKEAQANLKENGGEGSQAQYDALTREISETTVKLSGLKQAQAETANEFAQAQAKSSQFAQGLSTVGSMAEQVANKTKMLSMAAAGALGAMVALATKAGDQADEWLTLAQQTGLSTEAIQKFSYASEQIDVPLDTIVGAVNNMKRHLDDTSGVWDRIGVKVRDQQGNYRNIETIFDECVRALGNIHNETERDTASMKIFGRSANELAGLLDDGGQKMRTLGQEAQDIGAIVSDEDLEKLGRFDDLLEGMKTKLQFAAMQAAIPVMEALTPVIEDVASALEFLGNIVASIPSPILSIVTIFLMFAAILSPIAKGISGVCSAFSALIGILPSIGSALGSLISTATAAIAGNPYVGVILAIVAALVALGVIIYQIVTHWDEFKAAGSSAINAVKGFVSGLGEKFSSMASGIKSALGSIPEVITSIASKFATLIEAAQNVSGKIVGAFNSIREKAFKIGSEVMGAFANGIKSAIDQVTRAVQNLARALSSIWSSMTMDASRAGSQTASAYAQSYNSTSSSARLKTPSASSQSYYGSGNQTASLTSAINNLSSSMGYQSAAPVEITVELSGSAKNIFDSVRVENNKLTTATGYHALG